MECIRNLVGFWDGCSQKDSSLVYINDLPGLDITLFDYLTTPERQTATEIIDKILINAANDLEAEIRSHIDPKIRMEALVDNGIIGFYDRHRTLKNADPGFYGGINFEVPYGNNVFAYLQSVEIFTPNNYTNKDLYIYDLTTGVLLDTIQFDSTANTPTEVLINKTYKTNGQLLNLFICYDAGTSYKADVIEGGCGSCGWKKYQMSGWNYTRAGKISSSGAFILNNISQSTHTYGLSLKYQIGCDSGKFVCSISSRLKMAMYYKAGIAICDEIIHSKRLNNLTTVNLNQAKDLKVQYTTKYDNAMNHVLSNLVLPNDICFQCEPRIFINPVM